MIFPDPVSLANLIFCAVIILISLYGYYRIHNPTVLFIGIAFFAFGISHIATLLQITSNYAFELIIVRSLGYILVTIGSFFIIREVILRMNAVQNLQNAYEDIETRVKERTIELEQEISIRKSIEVSLRQSEEQFRNLFEHAPIGIFHSNTEGKLLAANPALAKIIGFASSKELIDGITDIGTQIFVDPDLRPRIIHALTSSEGWVHYDEILWHRNDGKIISIELTGRKVVNSSGDLLYFEGFAEDISERKIAERNLYESDAQFKRIIENLPVFVSISTLNDELLYLNPLGLQFYGSESDDIGNSKVTQLKWVDPSQRDIWVSKLVDYGMVSDFEICLQSESGVFHWMSAFGIIIRFENQNCILATYLDITQRKCAEMALMESEEKFISIFEETPDPIIIVSHQYQIINANQGFEDVFGIPREEIIGKSMNETALSPLSGKGDQIFEKFHEEKEITRDELIFYKKGEIPFISEIAISQIMIQSEPYFLIQIHDIDEIRRAHEAVAQVNNKLKILSSITRHDILNRIMVTWNYAEVVRDEVSNPVLQQKLNTILKVTEEIQNLIEFTGQYQDLGGNIPSWQQIGQIIRVKGIQSLIQGICLTSDLGNLEIYADNMLEKVMYNLVENSIRHGKDLTYIHLSSHEQSQDLIIVYEDNGGGIVADEKEMAFEKGFGKNTGLGLFLIREILSITGITIIEVGEPGVGVRFELRVPAGKFRIP